MFPRRSPSSGRSGCTAPALPEAPDFSERRTSWTRLSRLPFAGPETHRGTRTPASPSSCPYKRRAVNTESLQCGVPGRSEGAGSPADGPLFGRNTAWTPLSTLLSSVSGPPPPTAAHLSSCSWWRKDARLFHTEDFGFFRGQCVVVVKCAEIIYRCTKRNKQ